MADLRTLCKREHQLRISLDGIQKFKDSFQPERDGRQVTVRLEALENIFGKFVQTRERIELLLEDAEKEEEDKDGIRDGQQQEYDQLLQDFEDRYYALKADLLEFQSVQTCQPGGSGNPQAGMQPATQFARVKLPEIKLPSFSGQVQEWVPYRDSFRSLIHHSTLLTNIDKFTYQLRRIRGAVA